MVIGIDAGGTSVRIVLAKTETGKVVAEASAAADADGGPEAVARLWRKIDTRSGSEVVGAVVAGIAKITREGVRKRWETALSDMFLEAAISIVPDYVAAFHGAIPDGCGIMVISGTGSVAYGENSEGAFCRVGGRGWEYGDEGSGSHLTTEILRRTLRALDGIEVLTPLQEAVCASLDTSDPDLLGGAARQRAEAEGRGFLAPLVLEMARSGDEEAANLFIGSAGWLSSLVWCVHRRLGLAPEEATTIATIGGLWEAEDLILPTFRRLIARRMPGASVVPPNSSPVLGAVRMARRSLHGQGSMIDYKIY
jgi:glucosamine kinase